MKPKKSETSFAPLLFIVGFSLLQAIVLSVFWVSQTPSGGELSAYLSKSIDYYAALMSHGGWPWWTPSFLSGHSLAPGNTYLFTKLYLLLGEIVYPFQGAKFLILLAISLGAIGCFGWATQLTDHRWTPCLAGLFFLSFPSILSLTGSFEDIETILAICTIPYVLWFATATILRCSWNDTALLALSTSVLILVSAKSALCLAPSLVIYMLWLAIANPPRPIVLLHLAAATAAVLILGLLPLLPALRELQWLTGFRFDPLLEWQQTYSFKSPLALLDRDGALSNPLPNAFSASAGALYIGAIPLIALICLFAIPSLRQWMKDEPSGQLTRSIVILSVLIYWFAFATPATLAGLNLPPSLLSGHLAFLKNAFTAHDWTLPLFWTLVAGQVALLVLLLPTDLLQETTGRRHLFRNLIQGFLRLITGRYYSQLVEHSTPIYWILSVILVTIVFVSSPFWLLQKIPFFEYIRYPWLLWLLPAPAFVSLGTALVLQRLVGHVIPDRHRIAAITGFSLLILIDLFPYYFRFVQPSHLHTASITFATTQDQLAHSQSTGRIRALSNNQLFLLSPHLTDRNLTQELFETAFMLQWVRENQMGAATSEENLRTYVWVGGISHVIIDKQDDRLIKQHIEEWKKFLTPIHDDPLVLVLENENNLFPAFWADHYLSFFPPSSVHSGVIIEKAGQRYLAAIEQEDINLTDEGIAGWYDATDPQRSRVRYTEEFANRKASIFQRVSLYTPRKSDYHRIDLAPLTVNHGLITFTEAFHPDWKLYRDNQPAGEPLRAFGAWLGIPQQRAGEKISLIFEPPFWYDLCMSISALGWFLLLALVLFSSSLLAPSRWIDYWHRQQTDIPDSLNKLLKPEEASDSTQSKASPAPAPQLIEEKTSPEPEEDTETNQRKAIERPLLIIPVYDESKTIVSVLDQVLKTSPRIHILVVDDNSPDGTAEIVRKHSAFGKRVHLLERPGKLGLGSAYRDGFQWALRKKYDACLEMDADLSHDPADIPKLIEALNEGADLAIGSRYIDGVRVLNWPQSRLLLSTFAGYYTRFFTGLPLTDPTSGFKAIRRSVLRKLDWSRIRADGYGFQIELHYFSWRLGFEVKEIPIVFTERRGGQSKMSQDIAIEAAIRVLQLALTK